VRSDDKRRARLNLIAHFLSLIPYEDVLLDEFVRFDTELVTGKQREPKLELPLKGGYHEATTDRL
jgi:polyphosphate kinase